MDALQVISSAMEIVSTMVGAVSALEEASRNLDEAPRRIQALEEFVRDLENLMRRIKQKYQYKLQNPQLDQQVQSLNALINQLRSNIKKARRIVSKNKFKNIAKVVWNSMAGDPLGKLMNSMRNDLNWWLESQRLAQDLEKVIESTAQDVPVRMKVKIEQGYPVSSKCRYLTNLLEEGSSHNVILIVGLSGIGKSCLARQVASNPPKIYEDGAVELGFGQWCSRNACNQNKENYQKRLAKKICKFLLQIGYWKKIKSDYCEDLEYVSHLLQDALLRKKMVILLDDVWEQDIVERFSKLYNNDCKYLVTTRNEAVCEITEAEKVELSKDDIIEISKSILSYHCHLSDEDLPVVAESLLERCGHHPLTVAVMGKALRKETRAEKWERAIMNLSTFATCAPGPISYVNEKEAENTLTIFGSFEFSLEAMPADSRRLFISLASLSWAEPVPEACLEVIWSILGEESLFPLIVCKLVEGSLLMKTDTDTFYQVHDMVSLYLDGKINDSIEILLNINSAEKVAVISPWLLTFGKENVKTIAEKKMEYLLNALEEKQVAISLEALVQALMTSQSMSELEASRARFSRILGPKIAEFISTDVHSIIAMTSEAIVVAFTQNDYCNYFPSLENLDAIDKMARMVEKCEDFLSQTNILSVLAKLAEFGSSNTVDMVLQRIPFDKLADLLTPEAEEWHENVFTILMSLLKAGKSKAVERMFAFEIGKNLIELLESGSEVVQHHAIVTLKAFYEIYRGPSNSHLQKPNLDLLPWQVRHRLEAFVLSEQTIQHSSKPQTFEDLICKVLSNDNKQVSESMHDLMPVIERAGDSNVRDMLLESPLVERLADLLQGGPKDQNLVRSHSAFLLMKLACSGGEPCIKRCLNYNIIPELTKMMQCGIIDLQDSAYSTLHQMLFGKGGNLVLDTIFQMKLVDRMVQLIDSKSTKTREVNMLCILDLVELGSKSNLERILSAQIVEKLVKLEKSRGGTGEMITGLLKSIDKCKHLSMVERRVMKQEVVRKVRTGFKGHKLETRMLMVLDAFVSDAGSIGGGKRR